MVHGVGAAAVLLNCVSRSIVTVLLLTLVSIFIFLVFFMVEGLKAKSS